MNSRDYEQIIKDQERKYRELAARNTALYEVIEAAYDASFSFDEYHGYWPIVQAMDWERFFPRKVDGFGL